MGDQLAKLLPVHELLQLVSPRYGDEEDSTKAVLLQQWQRIYVLGDMAVIECKFWNKVFSIGRAPQLYRQLQMLCELPGTAIIGVRVFLLSKLVVNQEAFPLDRCFGLLYWQSHECEGL